MTSLRVYLWRLLELVSFRRREARLTEEVEAHLALLSERYQQHGFSAEEARLAARRDFGAVAPMAERHRDERGLPWFDALALDLRFAWRLLRRDRGFAATVVLVLGLGIGVNNMLFTILYAHTLRGLPIEHATRTAYVSVLDHRGATTGLSRNAFDLMTASATSFEGLAAFTTTPVTVSDAGRPPDRLEATLLTPTAFSLLDARPLRGRLLAAYDARPDSPAVAMLSRAAWLARYGGETGVIGRVITIDGVPTTIVGVLPDRPPVPSTGQVWLPLVRRSGASQPTSADDRTLRVIGRLRNGVTFEAAGAEMASLVTRFERTEPAPAQALRGRVAPIDEVYFGSVTNPAWLAFMAVGALVVLISCANVANLLLARALERTREIAMRLALGASRRRIVRQLLMESCVLATLGGVVGFGISAGGVQLFRSFIPENALPWWFDYSIDTRVCAALAAVSLATVVIFGLVPALHASKADVNHVLKNAGGRSGVRGARRWTTVFLTGELALTVVMLANLAQGLRLSEPPRQAEIAINRSDIVSGSLEPSSGVERAAERLRHAADRLIERLAAAPGVDAVSVTNALPLTGAASYQVAIDGQAEPDEALRAVMGVSIGARYFETLGVPMTKGREFLTTERTASVALVNPRFVERHLGQGDPIGRRITLKSPDQPGPIGSFTIVGVSPAIRQRAALRDEPVVYVPWGALPAPPQIVLLRGRMDSSGLAALLRHELLAIDSTMAVDRIRSMSRVIDEARWNSRLSSLLFQTLVAIAVLLATVGLYAVTTHAVSQRTSEIGLRVALGAGRGDVVRLVLRRVLTHVVLGFVTGVGFVVLWSRAFSSGRTDVTVTDPVTLGLVAIALIVLALIAALAPLRRAMRVDPLTAIRA